jgi:hypothetical protein
MCHRSGIGGNLLDEDSRTTFDAMTALPYLANLAVASWDDEGCYQQIVRSPLLLEKPERLTGGHPVFEWTEGRDAAIVEFFDRTHAAYLAGPCSQDAQVAENR